MKKFSAASGNKEEKKQLKKVHILVVSQYFYPENFRINNMAAEWVKRGYRVTVLTGIPNYPAGKFFKGYGYRKRRKEYWNGIKIIRIPVMPRGSGSAGMVLNYLSFVASGWIWKTAADVGADLVFTFEVSPMTQALVGCWYAKKHHIPHYLYVTDLWPENVESVTGIHSRAVIGPLQRMADYIYHNTDRILTCSESFIKKICQRGIPADKIEFWPQYAEDFYRPLEKKGNLLPQDGILNLVFAGNIGCAQGLGMLVEAAGRLKKENVRARFCMIGDGRYLCEMKKNIHTAGADDYFIFVASRPAREIPGYLAFADALLIILAKSEAFSITIPSKTQSCMACGKPVLVSADGEVQDIILKAGAGYASGAGDAEGFVTNIKKLMSLSAGEREKLASNALRYSREYFNKEKLLNRLDEIFRLKEGAADVSI